MRPKYLSLVVVLVFAAACAAQPTATLPAPGPVLTVTITGIVLDSSPSARTITLKEPVEGFGVVALTEESVLLSADGSAIGWDDIQPGLTIKASGEPGDADALLCGRLILLDIGRVTLTVNQVPIVAAEVDGPGRLEYNDRLGDEILARIESLREQAAERRLAQTNAGLAPFGYRLAARFDAKWNQIVYDLYTGEEEPLLPGLARLWPLSVNASNTEFVLAAENAFGVFPSHLLVSRDGVQAWDWEASRLLPPAYVGDALACVTAVGLPMETYRVELEGQAIYTGTVAGAGAYEPLRAFTTWDSHWVLEVDDHLIVDGQDVGQAAGYEAVFGFALIGEQPFYFFEQQGLVHISYGGQILPHVYEEVVHNQCCEASIHNVGTGPDAVWFHALKEGTWYFVEVGLDGESGPG